MAQIDPNVFSTEIILKNLTVRYGSRIALENISGTFEKGSMTAIIGPNGGGKTTLVKALQKIIKISSGSITYQNLKYPHIAYLPQQSSLDRSFPLSAQEVVSMGLWQETGGYKSFQPHHLEKIFEAFKKVGLQGFENRLLDSLSGGQFQRILFARLLLQDSPFIILDEPFSSIDSHTKEILMTLIKEWHQQGKTIIAVLHELDLVENHFPQSLLLARKAISWGKTQDVLKPENITTAFRALIAEGHPANV
jgi:zinc/manganese transport system ATP-binding protein